MMEAYRICLPNEKLGTYRMVTVFILLLNLFAFAFVFFKTGQERPKQLALIGTVISLTTLVIFAAQLYSKRFSSYRPGISFIILALFWLMLGKYLLALFLICFALFGFYAEQPFEVFFTKEKIIYPSFPKKVFFWDAVNNVMLKDGMLTIDLKNNTLIQGLITKASAERVDEKAFNDFCSSQLS